MNSSASQTQSRGPKTRRSQPGFTLIELLVVIAIIAILAAILFPVFQKVRENARRTACLSNQKQIGLGILQYNQDYDEKYIAGGNQCGRGSGWAGQLYPYVKSTAVFKCPDDSSNLPGTPVSYALNAQFSPYNGACNGSNGLALAQVTSPAKTVLIFEVTNSGYYNITIPSGASSTANCPNVCASDVDYYGGSPAGWGTGNTVTQVEMVGFNTAFMSANDGKHVQYATGVLRNAATNTNNNFTATPRHNDGANYTMADGHAKFFRSSAVSAGLENSKPGDCGGPELAATTTCSDSTIAATFNVAQ